MMPWRRRGLLVVGVLAAPFVLAGCDGVAISAGGASLPVAENENQAPAPAPLELEVFATNTGGATGIALRPSDGALFLVNADGLFGPIEEGDDVATMDPIGATNLGDFDLFQIEDTDRLVLAITESGEFWIGSPTSGRLAVVEPEPEAGLAEAFEGLVTGVPPSNIKPETMVIVPAGFNGPQMEAGNLLVGQETSFSRLSAIDVEGDGEVVNVDNPAIIDDPDGGLNREAHHLTFSPDGLLYGASGMALVSEPAVQTIDQQGAPASLPGTEALSANTFVVLAEGDLIVDGVFDPEGAERLVGLLVWSAEDEQVELGLELPATDISADDEMIITPDGGTIYLSLPSRNEIVRVIDNR